MIFGEIITSTSIWPKKVECRNFEDDCVLNGTTGKVAVIKHDIFKQNAVFEDTKCIIFKINFSDATVWSNCHIKIE